MIPARKGDGTGLSFNGASEVRKGDGTVLWSSEPAIPDSVVSRPDDNNSFNNASDFGLLFYTAVEWPDIGGRLSANISGATRAYVYRVSDGQLMGDADISTLSAGDAFTVGLDSSLSAGSEFTFVVDAEGSTFDQGVYNQSISLPYTSSDGNLEIRDNAEGVSAYGQNDNLLNIVEIGDVGFN